jgi:murein L,D-transpeptidase YafK
MIDDEVETVMNKYHSRNNLSIISPHPNPFDTAQGRPLLDGEGVRC